MGLDRCHPVIRAPSSAGSRPSLENLRSIQMDVNADLHLSQIRREWNQFYRENANPTKEQLLTSDH
jgi:hypothetical protein